MSGDNIMAMTTNDILDDIIASLDPEHVPPAYIVMAKVTDFDGNETIYRGKELEQLLRSPRSQQIAEARVILDVKKIRRAIIDEVSYIYDQVQSILARK